MCCLLIVFVNSDSTQSNCNGIRQLWPCPRASERDACAVSYSASLKNYPASASAYGMHVGVWESVR